MSESQEYVFERIVHTRMVTVLDAAAPKTQVRSETEYLLRWDGDCKFESSPGHGPECDNYPLTFHSPEFWTRIE